MLTKTLIGFAIVLAVFLLYIASRPANFTITRSAIIPADCEKVFAIVNDLHEWDHWSPWAKLDPNSKTSFDGPSAGRGAKFAWDGNSEVGSGRMEITESRPNESIKLDLIFTRPMQATNQTEFKFRPETNGTLVIWTMSGTNGFMGKLVSFVMNCDKMVGSQFEKGLENMKASVATAPASAS